MTSSSRAFTCDLPQTPPRALDEPRELGGHRGLLPSEQAAFGKHDDIERLRARTTPEALPQQSLGAVALYRSARSPADRESEPRVRSLAARDHQLQQLALDARAASKDPVELGRTPQSVSGAQPIQA